MKTSKKIGGRASQGERHDGNGGKVMERMADGNVN
jgi:hypothetical protein